MCAEVMSKIALSIACFVRLYHWLRFCFAFNILRLLRRLNELWHQLENEFYFAIPITYREKKLAIKPASRDRLPARNQLFSALNIVFENNVLEIASAEWLHSGELLLCSTAKDSVCSLTATSKQHWTMHRYLFQGNPKIYEK